MVRLINIDFEVNLDNPYVSSNKFLVNGHFADIYFYGSGVNDSFYSLNALSEHYLDEKEFLIYIDDYQFSLLFNHKTLYCIPLDKKYFKNDLIKAILLRLHIISILGMGRDIIVHYCINTSRDIESILHDNIKLNNKDIELKNLGVCEELVKPIESLDTKVKLLSKYSLIVVMLIVCVVYIIQGVPYIHKSFFSNEQLNIIQKKISLENRLKSTNQRTIDTLDNDIKKIDTIINQEKKR